MNKIIEFPNREHIYDQASLWIARLDRQLTTDEERELRRWLRENNEHKIIFLEMARLWDKMDSLSRLADLFQIPEAPQRRRITYSYAIAACFAVAAFALFLTFSGRGDLWFTNPPLTLVQSTFETPVGQYRTVPLPDGSVLIVNTHSRVRVEYTDAARLFFLERGEINIEVAKNPSRPLKVIAQDKVVQAVGTAFNLRIVNDKEMELLVTHGKVLVAQTTKDSNALNSPRIITDAIAVSGGERIVLGSQNQQIAKITTKDMDAELSWRTGNLVFQGETLAQALAEISRYTAVEFEIIDNTVRDQRIAGLFKAGDVDGLLAALEHNFNIYHERLGENHIRLTTEKRIDSD